MNWYEICKTYYDLKCYDNTTLKKFVVKGKITAEQYQQITGVTYVA